MEAYSKDQVLFRNAFIKQETGLTELTTYRTDRERNRIDKQSKSNLMN